MIATLPNINTFAASAEESGENKLVDGSSWRSVRRADAPRPPVVNASARAEETVLVVDSAPMMRGVVVDVLRQLGYRVVEASNAIEAQRLAQNQREIHLLLLALPEVEPGDLQLALWFRCMYPKTKILVTSDRLWELNFQLAVAQQIALLAKPFTSVELANIVRRVLE